MEGANREGEYHLGLLSVGYSVVNATIACNTDPSLADMQAAPNVRTGVFCAGAVVHSLGQEPAVVIINPIVTSVTALTVLQITADNSAVYARAHGVNSIGPLGMGVRVVAIAP